MGNLHIFWHSCMNEFTQEIDAEHLARARSCSWQWRYSGEQDRWTPVSMALISTQIN